MRTTTSVCVAGISLLLGMPIPQPDILMTVPQGDTWRSTMTPASASVSADGRYVALTSYASLVPADTDDRPDIYVLDRVSGRVTLESLTADDLALTGDNGHPRLSGDGRYLVFQTALTDGGGTSDTDIVLRDRVRDTATRVDRGAASGAPRSSNRPAISEDGRFVVFGSAGTDLVPGRDENGAQEDIYEFEAATRVLRRVSVDGHAVQRAAGASFAPVVSGDGRFVAFTSTADLDSAPPRGTSDARQIPEKASAQVYVRDMELGTTTRVSIGAGGIPLDGASYDPAISRDGRYVAFVSAATNVSPNDRNRSADVFVRDLLDRSTALVSRRASGGTANGPSGNPAISGDGRFVAFQSEASDLVCARRCPPALDDTNLLSDVFLYERATERMTWISALPAGGWAEESGAPQLDSTAEIVAFTSRHPIDERDVSNDFDLFVRFPSASSMSRQGD